MYMNWVTKHCCSNTYLQAFLFLYKCTIILSSINLIETFYTLYKMESFHHFSDLPNHFLSFGVCIYKYFFWNPVSMLLTNYTFSSSLFMINVSTNWLFILEWNFRHLTGIVGWRASLSQILSIQDNMRNAYVCTYPKLDLRSSWYSSSSSLYAA